MLQNAKVLVVQLFIIVFLILIDTSSTATQKKQPIQWQKWGSELFTAAKESGKHILLDLNARWCHWCHFMEQRTYKHPAVEQLVQKGYLAVKVDQDANPDLSARYGDWGWPATIIFDPNGKEVAKFQGFLRPSSMLQILYTIRNHPDQVPALAKEAGTTVAKNLNLSKEQQNRILNLLDETYDKEFAGWGRRLKFLQPEVIEYALKQARLGNKEITLKVKASLDAAISLIDKEWGGYYQYSHERDWSAPHFEKIMWSQARSMYLYASAYKLFREERYLRAALDIERYLSKYLRSEMGAFYTSQDADVDEKILGKQFYELSSEDRVNLGKFPPIDKNIYARENGWAISSFLFLYSATGNSTYLDTAIKAANWIIENRSLPKGGFQHGDKDLAGPYLSDNISMGQALLDLYMSTGDINWLKASAKTADFIHEHFKHKQAGFITTKNSSVSAGVFKKPFRNIEENIRLARYSNMLSQTLGKERHLDMAKHVMRYLATDNITSKRRFLLGLLLLDQEMSIEPAHITIVGSKKDKVAKDLHLAGLKLPIAYKRIDWWDPTQGAMLNPDVTYPKLEKPAAFACANKICSLPVFSASELPGVVKRIMNKRAGVTK